MNQMLTISLVALLILMTIIGLFLIGRHIYLSGRLPFHQSAATEEEDLPIAPHRLDRIKRGEYAPQQGPEK